MTRPIVKSLAAIAVAGVLLSGCGGGGQSFTTPTYPFSFKYPAGWTLARGANFTYAASDQAVRSVSAALKEPYDQVTITEYKMKKKLPPGANGYRPEVDRIVARLTKHAGGKAGRTEVVEYGGIPGYQYIVQYPGGEGLTLENKLTFLFKGQSEFQVNCQSSPKNRVALNKGCDQILDSLKFD